MAVETGTIISDFDVAKPAGTEPKSILDDQIKWVKSAILATFANITGAVTTTHTELMYQPNRKWILYSLACFAVLILTCILMWFLYKPF